MRLNPRYPPHLLFQLGWAYNSAGRYAEAVATLQDSSAGAPIFRMPTSSWPASLYVPVYLTESGCPDAGTGNGSDSTDPGPSITPSPGSRVLGRGSLYGKSSMSRPSPRRAAVTLNPNLADSYAALAETLSRVGKSEERAAVAEQALLHKPWWRRNT